MSKCTSRSKTKQKKTNIRMRPTKQILELLDANIKYYVYYTILFTIRNKIPPKKRDYQK